MDNISMKRFLVAMTLCGGIFAGAVGRKEEFPREVKPEDAIATFEIPAGFQIEMVASEPAISDPVAMEIDENGVMYVVEMHGYPLDKSGTGKVRTLHDTDGDGQMDRSVIFAENLVLPTGILRWKKGVLVTDPPNVLYLEDTDNDGKADKRDTLLTGFAMSNPQHNFNNPILGIDNWIYLGHEPAVTTKTFQKEFGDRGGEILYPHLPDSPRLPENGLGRGVRFRPDAKGLEVLSSYTQFGHTFDQWGHYLLVSNANPGYHEVIANRYLLRNPDLLVSKVTQTLSDHSSEVFPITKNPQHQLLTDLGVFTSACGLTSYQGGLFPAPYDSVAFVAEPVSNLVHADLIRDSGASFTASRIQDKKEFLASTDSWFRPVNMYIGPDGALYVMDYYRQIIEHPEWMADEVVKSGALYNGRDMGRIYRISPKGTPRISWPGKLDLNAMTDADLVQKLADRNIWWRRHAQRLLLDRHHDAAIPLLKSMATGDNPHGRLHALWTLEGLDALRAGDLQRALRDPHAGVTENAIKIAELHLAQFPELIPSLTALAHHANAKVRFQALLTLGEIRSADAQSEDAQSADVLKAREAILFRDLRDPWVQTAALTSAYGNDMLFAETLKRYKPHDEAYASLVQRLSTLTGARGDAAAISSIIRKALAPGGTQGWQAPVLRGLAESLSKRTDLGQLEAEKTLLLNASFKNANPEIRQAGMQLLRKTGLPAGPETQAATKNAVLTASNKGATAEKRAEAIQFLSFKNPAAYSDVLQKLVVPSEPRPVQIAALKTLNAIPDETVCRLLLERWASLTPDVRESAIGFFLSDPKRITLLLDGLEQGKIDQATLGWPRSVSLMAHHNETLRNRARQLLTQKDSQRQVVIQSYKPVMTLAGNPQAGKLVFEQQCAVCHQIAGAGGVAFGPDLGTVRNRRPESIMGDILDPNFSIADGYDLLQIELGSGESAQGLIASETPSALTLSNYGGQKRVIARKDIKSLKTLGMSSMPVGLEASINQQQMADLLAFIKNAK
ncbi:PVC-type heme-binding CxxCH protein [Dyadobacter sp.]|uniref:PVC-type heme-binding CxxCH protein n=1 Tax=Dyadobacter sp. TaxID=1914288 RepID=UPI0025BF5C49|nr:PVC-type heme-binding CxxCH protein [Dyadobacter sp.]